MRLQDSKGYTPITKDTIDNIKCARIISGEGSDIYSKLVNRQDEFKIEIR